MNSLKNVGGANGLIGSKEGNFAYCRKQKRHVKVEEETKSNSFPGGLYRNGEQCLRNLHDVITFNCVLREVCQHAKVKKRVEFGHLDFFIKSLAHHSVGDSIQIPDPTTIEVIDQATGGGCLVAEAGMFQGNFTCFDINNSYNAFFIDYKIPTNPRSHTITAIERVCKIQLYRVAIRTEHWSEELNRMFKLRRKWFTGFDLKTFDLFGIKYDLVLEENNTIAFDTVDADFSFLEKINELKQSTDKQADPIRHLTLKKILSSFWGVLCQFNLVEEKDEPIDAKYFHYVCQSAGALKYKKPIYIYRFAIAIAKPFIMAYARARVLKMIHKCRSGGFKVIYCHTDSIITDAPEKMFKMGTKIGEWKVEKSTDEGVAIKHIRSKEFL